MANSNQASDSAVDGASAQAAGGKNPRNRGFFSQLNHDATITGVVKSTFSNARRGADVVSSGLNEVSKTSRKFTSEGRIETFDNAMERLGIEEVDLPLIHNQIVLQSYLAFFIGLGSMTMAAMYILTTPFWGSGLLCAVVGMTSFVYFFQSSAQALQIRSRELGLLGRLLISPSEWFPSRLTNVRKMAKNDPLRLASVVQPMAKSAQARMGAGFALLVLAVVIKATDLELQGGPWGTLFLAFALVFLLLGASKSFEVFKRRSGEHCDMTPWLFSPSNWVPAAIDPNDGAPIAAMGSSPKGEKAGKVAPSNTTAAN